MRMRLFFAATALFAAAPLAARAEDSCHLQKILQSGEFPAWTKAGMTCRVDRNHQPGASSEVTKAPDHGTLDLQDSYWTYAPNPGFKGRDTFSYTVNTVSRRGAGVFITIDMDVR